MTLALDGLGQILGADRTRKRLSTRRTVDRQDQRVACVAKGGGELIQQRRRAIGGVWLKDDPHVALHGTRGGSENGRDLGGVVAIVVDDPDAARPTAGLKAAPRALKTAHRRECSR